MLGHLKPRSCRLSSQSRQHYQHLYCSICYSLRQQFGLSASLLINHELTLSLVAFPEHGSMDTESCACPAKLFCGQKPILRTPIIDKAAELCLLLVWLKLIDSETDTPAFYKKRLRQSVEHKVRPVLANLTPATRQFIDSYLLLIRANSSDFSHTTKMSGLLAKQVFQELDQDAGGKQKNIAEITAILGELITLADALLDLKQDIQHRQFNPIISATERNNSTLAEEYDLLKADYKQRMRAAISLMRSANLSEVNPLFNEILQQSLCNLTGKIQHAHNALFAADSRNRGNNSRASHRREWCECSDGCCDCCQCCQCCETDGCAGCSCCEGGGGCCDGCG